MVWDQHGRTCGWSAPALFTTGLFEQRQWRARWIAAEPDRPLLAGPPPANNTSPPVEPRPLPLLRRDFHVTKPVRCAIVCVSGLGQYELRLNGRHAGRGVLNPGWTNYRRTVLYNTFDVTSNVKRGANTIGVMLGNGLYNVERYPRRYAKFTGTFGQPKLILQLKLAFSDGSEQLISLAPPYTMPSVVGNICPAAYAIRVGHLQGEGNPVPDTACYFSVTDVVLDGAKPLSSIELRCVATETLLGVVGMTLLETR